ncbi:hypothetical protein PG996_007722 [Apiospora saccharicola]|uniref:Uncharacterized protein n=1 Tax=Apiospora saccharicola TaxID=335842 RepID=A0ABR1VBN9_9PEZI
MLLLSVHDPFVSESYIYIYIYIRSGVLQVVYLTRHEPPKQDKIRPSQALVTNANAKTGVFRSLLGLFLLLNLYPLLQGILVSTWCRIPNMCQSSDVASFKMSTLLQAQANLEGTMEHFREHSCVNQFIPPEYAWLRQFQKDQGRPPLLITKVPSGTSEAEELLLSRAKQENGVLYQRDTVARIDALCRAAAAQNDDDDGIPGDDEATTKLEAHRDLLRSLYRTTGPWPQLLHQTRLHKIGQKDVDDLAAATLASAQATVGRWTHLRDLARGATTSLAKLQDHYEQFSAAQDDLDTLPFVAGVYREPVRAASLWGLLRAPRVVHQVELYRRARSLGDERHEVDMIELNLRDIQRALNDLEQAMEADQDKFDALWSVSKRGLLRDWKFQNEDVVWQAHVWRPILTQLYGLQTCAFFRSSPPEPEGAFWTPLWFLKVVIDPVVAWADMVAYLVERTTRVPSWLLALFLEPLVGA